MNEIKTFPVLWQGPRVLIDELTRLGCPRRVWWSLVQSHEKQALANHQQTLAELAERGGLDPTELVAVLEDRPWQTMTTEAAVARLRDLVDQNNEQDERRYVYSFPSDDGPEGEAPRLEIFFNWDWYLCVIPAGAKSSWESVRFCTSGSRRPEVMMAVALLASVIEGNQQTIKARAHSLLSIAIPEPIPPFTDLEMKQKQIDDLEAYVRRLRAALRDEIRRPCIACEMLPGECEACAAHRERIEAVLDPKKAVTP